MTADDRAIEALAKALLDVLPATMHPSRDAYYAAAVIWSRIDKAALRAALLADLRREVAALPYGKVDGIDVRPVGAHGPRP